VSIKKTITQWGSLTNVNSDAQPCRRLVELNDLDLDLDLCPLTFNTNKRHAMSTLHWTWWKHAQSTACCFTAQSDK